MLAETVEGEHGMGSAQPCFDDCSSNISQGCGKVNQQQMTCETSVCGSQQAWRFWRDLHAVVIKDNCSAATQVSAAISSRS